MSLLPRVSPPAAVSLAVLALLAADSVRADPFDNNPKILLHARSATLQNWCTALRFNLPDCQDALTAGATTPFTGTASYYVYFLAARGSLPDVGAAQFGLYYDGGGWAGWRDMQKVDILSVFHCNGYPIMTDLWPAPFSGVTLSWDNEIYETQVCQTEQNVVMGYFYVNAYAPDTLGITLHPETGTASVSTCSGAETVLDQGDLGYLVFTNDAGTPGCNPCVEECPPLPAPPPPPPVNTAEPRIMLHITSPTSKNACVNGDLADPALAVTEAGLSTPSGPFYFVYLAAARERLPDIAGVQCGITYESNSPGDQLNGNGVDIFSWTLCGSLEFPSTLTAPWPAPGSATLVTWDRANRCQDDATAVAGYFYVGAYSEDRILVIPHPADGLAKVARCDVAEYDVGENHLGYVSFSDGAVTLGCNPWTSNCAQPVPTVTTTWGGIKSLFLR